MTFVFIVYSSSLVGSPMSLDWVIVVVYLLRSLLCTRRSANTAPYLVTSLTVRQSQRISSISLCYVSYLNPHPYC